MSVGFAGNKYIYFALEWYCLELMQKRDAAISVEMVLNGQTHKYFWF